MLKEMILNALVNLIGVLLGFCFVGYLLWMVVEFLVINFFMLFCKKGFTNPNKCGISIL